MKNFILIITMVVLAFGVNANGYRLKKVWEFSTNSVFTTTDVRQGFGMDGKFYINDKGTQTIYILDENGLTGETMQGGANSGITRDEAGNILVSTATFPSPWDAEAGIKVINPHTGETIEYIVPEKCGLQGRCDFLGFAKGNFFENGVLYLTGGNYSTGGPYTDGVAIFTVTDGEVNTDECYLAALDGATSQHSLVINYYKDLNRNDALLYAFRSGAPSKLVPDGDKFTKAAIVLPSKGYSNGCFPFVWDDKELFIYPYKGTDAANYLDGWAIAEAGAEEPLVAVPSTVAAASNGFQTNWLNAEVDAYGVTIYQYYPGGYLAVWRLKTDCDFVVDGIRYEVLGEDEVQVSGAVDGTYVNIPESVTYDGVTYHVIGIDDRAFAECYLGTLVLPVTLNSIASDAFLNCSVESLCITGNGSWQGGAIEASVGTLYIGSGVTGIMGLKVSADEVICYATTPPICDELTFTDYDATLLVPSRSFAAYFVAPYWSNFGDIVGNAVEPMVVALNEDNAELLVDEQISLTATVNPANAMPNTVTWYTTDASVATVNNGLVTAVGSGECDVVAACLDKMAVCHITASVIGVTSIVLNQEEASLEVNEQILLTATVTPNNATYGTVTWSTTAASVATVNNGLVTAVGPGECDIIATCGGVQAVCHVIVIPQIVYITLDMHTAEVLPNHMIMISPSMTPVSTELMVTSSDPSVAAARLMNGKVQVVGIKEGISTITVASVDGIAIPATCLVTVYTEPGDLDCDGFVSIGDVTSLIDYLLSGDDSQISIKNADVNGDSQVSIADVTALIDYLLSGAWSN